MSRIGKLPIPIPNNVQVQLEDDTIKVKGPKGELTHVIPAEIGVVVENNVIIVSKNTTSRKTNEKYGLTRSLINNLVIGVSNEFEKKLQLVGVGYRAQADQKALTLSLGFSHPVIFDIPENIKVKVEANTNISITGVEKEKVGLFAAKIRAKRPPEPYKGKGVRYVDEIVLRKAGKSGK
jgi:large subunit ribosomal protein L6